MRVIGSLLALSIALAPTASEAQPKQVVAALWAVPPSIAAPYRKALARNWSPSDPQSSWRPSIQ